MISIESAEKLIDFSAGVDERKPLAKQQIEGSVALYNILQKKDLAYLADEVGMGKTYVALGTIALMRKTKPDLRVLYLLPKNNVRDKWVKDYKSFVEHNYLHNDLIVSSLDRTPAAPYTICKNLGALIREAALGNNQDLFICSSALSFTLSSDASSLIGSLKELLSIYSGNTFEIETLIEKLSKGNEPLNTEKSECKSLWAKAINRILPKFDLIVVDEAHNFKRGGASSDRNRNLATVLGTSLSNNSLPSKETTLIPLVNKVLLLSATPYEYHLDELSNQLVLFGSGVLSTEGKEQREALLPGFMVRRLNEINIKDKPHTRNMYRDEHRAGEQAEVKMNDAQKLFAALMQKRISGHLRENHAGKYQTGLLASFESYMPNKSAESEHATFDGDEEDRKDEAKDENVVSQLIESYQLKFNQTPPHPKMDWVVTQLHEKMYSEAKKQLIFVRRVASVGELKAKFEEAYDKDFVKKFIEQDPFVENMYMHYLDNKYKGGLEDQGDVTLNNNNTEPNEGDFASDDFFTWFYRGRNKFVEESIASNDVTPHNFRQKMAQRSTMFELNWANFLIEKTNKQYDICMLREYSDKLENAKSDTDDQKRFQVAQYCYLNCLAKDEAIQKKYRDIAERLLKYIYKNNPPKVSTNDKGKLLEVLKTTTFFDVVTNSNDLKDIFPFWSEQSLEQDVLSNNDALSLDRAIHRREILRMILAYICRVDHPWIDLYSVRGNGNEQNAFISKLRQQKAIGKAFSSYQILKSISSNADLLIKLNFSEAYRKDYSELMRYISSQIRNLQSCAGASGINSGDRSPLARRFRMPGYPMVLISTNVFQEGEDLHTFCDSVNHYGLSSSPIALEQKVGRVDRIGSMAQRRIVKQNDNAEQHFIQVRYPHIKQSIEYMQVQNSAYNLNQFVKNLHKTNHVETVINSEQDIDNVLTEVEPQIRSYLTSPFVAEPHITADCQFDQSLITCQKGKLDRLVESIESAYLASHSFENTSKGLSYISEDYCYEIRAARKSNELVLSITQNIGEGSHLSTLMESDCLLDSLQQVAKDYICRLQLINNKGEYLYKMNVERLFCVQQSNVKSNTKEVSKEFEMNMNRLNPLINLPDLSNVITQFQYLHTHVEVSILGEKIRFDFNCSNRKQVVSLTHNDDYFCFSSQAISPEKLKSKVSSGKSLNTDLLLKYTAGRNVIYDLVDFHINDNAGISVRAFCQKGECNEAEKLRIMYRVAREADRLEYLFSDEDVY